MAGVIIFSLTIHEYSHALAADKLGDPTAKYFGRLSLNPKAHLDPIGTLMMFIAGFGWGKPVPFNPANLKNPKRDSALIAFAGPASNFGMAIVCAILFQVFKSAILIGSIFHLAVYYNLILCFFNLIPVHPLDGFKVIYGILPTNLAWQWEQAKPYGVMILIILILTKSTGILISPLVGLTSKFLGL